MSSQLKTGMLWSAFEVILKRGLDFTVNLVLARLLFPETFGIVGMATVFISFIQVVNEAGMGLAIIQKKNITNIHLNTAFWANVIWSVFLFTLSVFVIAPLAVTFFDEPLLGKVIPILGLSILASALNTVHTAQLKKALRFKEIALVNNVSVFLSGIIAIILAFLDFGIWAIVLYTVIRYCIQVPLYYRATRWFPSIILDKKILKEFISFGVFTTGTRVVKNLVNNADYLLIGKWVGSAAVGTYTLGYMMTRQVQGQILTMVERVMYPFYSSIQNDMERMKIYYLNLIGYYALILFPIMLTLILFGKDLIPLVFGEKWEGTVLPTQLLSLAVMINALTTGYGLLFRSIGKPKYEFKIERITSLIIYLPLLIVGTYFYGINGSAFSVLIAEILSFFYHQYILKKYFQIKIGRLLNNNSRIIILMAVLGIITSLLKYYLTHNFYIVFCVYIVLFISTYYLLFWKSFLMVIKGIKK